MSHMLRVALTMEICTRSRRACCDNLIGRRLEQVIVVPIDDGDFERGFRQLLGGRGGDTRIEIQAKGAVR